MTSVLRIENLKLGYVENDRTILEIRELEFRSGINLIVGRNGAGKSTLLRALSGYGTFGIRIEGTIMLNGRIYDRAGTGLVEQRPVGSINIDLSFLENLLLATLDRFSFLGLGLLATRTRVARLELILEELGLADRARVLYPCQASMLSAGQQQLLAILMRLIRNQEVLLLDECTASLDWANARMILDTLLKVGAGGTVILFATHQQELIGEYNASIYEVRDKEVYKKSPTSDN